MIHQFEHNGVRLTLDVFSGAVHILDAVASAVCRALAPPLEKQCPEALVAKLSGQYGRHEVLEAYEELFGLYEAGLLFSRDPEIDPGRIKSEDIPVKALCLHISHDCNLRCQYCFAQTGDFGAGRALMSPEVARAAVDFVIQTAQGRRNIEIDFFGGEPLMAWETLKQTVEYAKQQGDKHGKVFRFTVTTNGVLLDDAAIAYINEHMSNAVLSADGRQAVHDAMRPAVSGAGSFSLVMPRFKRLVERRGPDKDYYIRGTYTAHNLDFSADVMALYEQGFDQISIEPVTAPPEAGFALKAEHLPAIRDEYWRLAEEILRLEEGGEHLNFFHFNVDLEQGPCLIKRLRGCGAGCEYVAVTPEGDLYPCHQFVGIEAFKMGNVVEGRFDRAKARDFSSVSVYTRPACRECWARFYCSGGCSAVNYFSNGDIDASYELGCEIERIRLECALYMAARRALGQA